jgi:hypoxanthine phosphoribosyltransferase
VELLPWRSVPLVVQHLKFILKLQQGNVFKPVVVTVVVVDVVVDSQDTLHYILVPTSQSATVESSLVAVEEVAEATMVVAKVNTAGTMVA